MIETGVTFHLLDTGEDFHSFHDLNLVLAPFTYAPAKPKLNLLDVAGADGTLDLTEATGEVRFYDREFTLTFSVFPQDTLSFEDRQTVVANAINGRRCHITFDKDPDYYWVGRCAIDEYKTDRRHRTIVITATVAPYKWKQHPTVVSFTLSGTGVTTVYLTNGRKSVIPDITCTASAGITIDSSTHGMVAGNTYRFLDLQLKQGVTAVQLVALGEVSTVTFTYREGEL